MTFSFEYLGLWKSQLSTFNLEVMVIRSLGTPFLIQTKCYSDVGLFCSPPVFKKLRCPPTCQ